jgi:hypothetical protein
MAHAVIVTILTLAASASSQMVGGYKPIAVNDWVTSVGTYALGKVSAETKKNIELLEVVKAERQVVQGSNYRLCMQVALAGSDDDFHIQAIVYQDLKNNYSVTKWVATDCTAVPKAAAPVAPPIVGGFKRANTADAQVIAAADFAVNARSEQLETAMSVASIVSAEYQMVQGKKFRLCIKLNDDEDEPIAAAALVNLFQDLKGNYKLTSWVDGGCR